MSRILHAWINEQHIGTLHEANGVWAFEYSAKWLAHPDRYPLCPGLPLREGLQRDGGTTRPVQWYFDNLLPEEGQRTLLAGSASLDAHDAFALLAYYGAESAGSVTLLPDTASEADRAIHPLPDDELSRRIRQMPHIPLTHEAKKRMSLAGARHKLAVILTPDDGLYEPVGGTASTHILKPDHPDLSYAHSVINEWFVMTLAARVKLNVPTVSRRYVPQPVYLIQRFDRQQDGEQGWIRLHSIDACQLLGLDRAYKYSPGSVELLARLANLCAAPAIARGQLFSWLTFNVLTGNTDAHLKNLSFLVDHDGIRLAPFYDLLSTAVYETRAFDRDGWPAGCSMAWPIGQVDRLQAIARTHLIEAGQAMGIKPATAGAMIDRLRANVMKEALGLYDETEQAHREIGSQRPELRPTLGGELRCLRAITKVIIADMCRQVGAAA